MRTRIVLLAIGAAAASMVAVEGDGAATRAGGGGDGITGGGGGGRSLAHWQDSPTPQPTACIPDREIRCDQVLVMDKPADGILLRHTSKSPSPPRRRHRRHAPHAIRHRTTSQATERRGSSTRRPRASRAPSPRPTWRCSTAVPQATAVPHSCSPAATPTLSARCSPLRIVTPRGLCTST